MSSIRLDPGLEKFLANAVFAILGFLIFIGIPGRIAQRIFGFDDSWVLSVSWMTPLVLLSLVIVVVLVKQSIAPARPK